MKAIGTLGEQLVARWLQLRNYELLEYNWRCRWGEIDLVAQDPTGAIAFVEVKTRSAYNWDVDGLLSINATKQQKLIQTASLFLSKHPDLAELPCRFDVGLVSYQSCNATAKANFNFDQINHLKIGQAIIVERHQLTLKDYLKAAFD
ncbi:YraN family protein [Pleurocapsa sp. CCALA 161]|uniref:YraN family protein n=1 Tax=Pleurocapsa sp. CCALA 161 TaxID=2107688 RepID=UPI000D05527C|nr:YraN family protein [Pleurocapsa sp. CCALA 161]PSB10825.1 YraN family protein [Pleurocapsa sp. CCALA 161]